MWQLIQDNFISHYHEYIGDLHHMLVALSKIQTFVSSWTPLLNIRPDCVGPAQAAGDLPEAIMAVDRNI